ncbi:acetoacetate--CoA ligase [Acidimicrobiales bacterium]|jgi:acetoacetyl-CoA synthetase|nr:acetoacetate--CoA ligase [Acidimicrobiales bacterium]
MTQTSLWAPSQARIESTNLFRFQKQVGVADYRELHQWSVANPAEFWAAAWDFCGIVGDRGDRLIEVGAEFRETRFLPDATLNVAENLLGEPTDDLAMVFRGEDGEAVDVTRAELHEMVGRIQSLMRTAGVSVGDRIAAWLPNRPETYAVMLAATGLGAVFCSTSPDFGVDGVIDRFGQIEPVMLFAVPSYAYNGKRHDCLARLGEITDALPAIRETVVVEAGWLDDAASAPITTRRLPFDHPWYVLFSSGTTGKPKCIVHRTGGVLLKHMVEHQLHCDIHSGDRVFYFTTAGWMMWNWLASALASDATLVLFDGAPTYPNANRLFDLVDETGATLLGISAKFIDACANAGIRPVESHDLSTVRSITSTGSTLTPEGFEWVYENVKTDVFLASMSGGTDLCGCLVIGDPTSPVFAGEIQVPGLGMDIDVVGASGESVERGVEGELVCRSPFPSMPLSFWNDPGDIRYKAAYFDQFEGMWHHGDFISQSSTGGYVISGRSDATLNPGGVRIGTAEIYRRVDTMPEVEESVVIGQSWDSDTRIVLFVKMVAGEELTDEVQKRIRSRIRAEVTPRHVPAVIAAVTDIPRTRSGKITELAVRDVVAGRAIANVEALANPEALEQYRDRPELAR